MMEYVLMNRAHVEQVAELERICFNDPWSLNSICSELDNSLSLWFVAIENNRVVGYVGSQTVLGETDMMNLAVHPDFRCMGIGRALVEALVFRLKEQGGHALMLEVRASNAAAISLYMQLGFYQVGCRPGYYRNPREDALILRKEWSA